MAKGRPTSVAHGEALADPRTSAPNTTDRYQAASALARSMGAPDYSMPVPDAGAGVTAGTGITAGGTDFSAPERTSSQAGVTAGDVLNRSGPVVTAARGSAAGVRGAQTGSARGVVRPSGRMKRPGPL